MSIFILECHGIQFRNLPFILKEITVLDFCSGLIACHLNVAPPVPLECLEENAQYMSHRVSASFHGLEWCVGDVPYAAVSGKISLIVQEATLLITKGSHKKAILEELLQREVFDMEELDPKPPKLALLKRQYAAFSDEDSCDFHTWGHPAACSLIASMCEYRWLIENCVIACYPENRSNQEEEEKEGNAINPFPPCALL